MATHSNVVSSFYNGNKARGYAMSTDGQNLYSYDKKIGRTLEDGTKQILGLMDVYTVSVSTRKHIGYALRGGGWGSSTYNAPHELIWPQVTAPRFADHNDFMDSWHMLEYPDNRSIQHIRATKQTFKTFDGCFKATQRLNNPLAYYVSEVHGGYSYFFMQYVDDLGRVVSAEEYYNGLAE